VIVVEQASLSAQNGHAGRTLDLEMSLRVDDKQLGEKVSKNIFVLQIKSNVTLHCAVFHR